MCCPFPACGGSKRARIQGLNTPIFGILFENAVQNEREQIADLACEHTFDGPQNLVDAFCLLKGYNKGMSDSEQKSKPIFMLLGGTVLGVVGFVVVHFVLRAELVIGLLAGAGAFAAGLLVFRGKSKSKSMTVELPHGVTQEALDQALVTGKHKLNLLKGYAYKISDINVRKEADDIGAITDRILQDIRQDPKDLRRARQFLNYYLDATVKILRRYVDISSRGLSGGEIDVTLKKVENSLSTIHKAFEKQLAKLMEDDVMDLDTEVEVLERTIRMEGLGDDTSTVGGKNE